MEYWPGEADEVLSLKAADGTELCVERFESREGAGATVLVFLHGIGAYAGPFRRFARELADRGCTVYLPDLRGHGRSGGHKGVMGSPKVILDDLEMVLQHVRASCPESEILLGGESMGGLIALAYSASARLRPNRLVLFAPALRPRWRNFPRVVRTAGRSGGSEGRYALQEPIHGEPVRDAKFRRSCLSDPLMMQRGSVRYVLTIGRFMAAWAVRYPSKVEQPCLLVHGDADAVLTLEASRALNDLLPRAELHVVPGAWHNLLWDPTRESTTSLVSDWLSEPSTTRARLCVYRWSALQAWFRSRSFGFWRVSGAVVLGFGLLAVIAASFSGTVFAAPGTPVWFGSATNGGAGASYLSSATQVAIPLSRDYLFMIATLLCASYIAVQQLHWRAISEAPRSFEASGLIDSDVVTPDMIDEAVVKADGKANSRAGVFWAAGISGLVAATLMAVALHYGVYGLLTPNGASPDLWQRAAVLGWWANPSTGSLLSMLAFGAVLFVFIYAMFRGNQIGLAAVEMLDDLLGLPTAASRRQRSGLRVVAEHPDGLGGLAAVKAILRYAMISTGLLFGALTVLLLLMPREMGVVALPFLVVMGVFSPYLVSRPVYALNGELRRQRRVLIEEANRGIASASADDGDAVALSHWIWRRDVAERLPHEVYSLAKFAALTAAYVVPLATLLLAMSR